MKRHRWWHIPKNALDYDRVLQVAGVIAIIIIAAVCISGLATFHALWEK